MTDDEAGALGQTLWWLTRPAVDRLSGQLAGLAGLGASERAALTGAARSSLDETLLRKVSRMLVLELHGLRLTGRLTAPDPAGRWAEFLELAGTEAFWQGLTQHYPTLLDRLRAVTQNRCDAVLALGRRFAADRAALADLAGGDLGPLAAVTTGAGDSHRGGQAVAVVRCEHGTVVYKPRPMQVDAQLARLLAALTEQDAPEHRITVPPVVVRDGYGWSGHVAHRYCAGDGELRAFYRNLGHWLAVMRLVAGTDLHSENIIACGPVPVVVDCETIFTPQPPIRPSGRGDASDQVMALLSGTVLRTGLLPGRGVSLGFRGVDISAAGALPGQQPEVMLPMIVDAGTDMARVEMAPVPVDPALNHPCPQPELGRYWGEVLTGLEAMAGRISRLDAAGGLEPLLAGFAGCEVRVIVRNTETYAELMRMLWHPASLSTQPAAVERARGLLFQHSMNNQGPAERAVHLAEVDNLLVGDIPVFATTPEVSQLRTPADTLCGPEVNQIALALQRWRDADLRLELRVARAALVSAYLNEGWEPDLGRVAVPEPDLADREGRRRAHAASLIRRLAAEAVHGADGTATWFAPVMEATGWHTSGLGPDAYGGILGMALVLAGYRREVAHGRADPVEGLDRLLAGTLRTARMLHEVSTRDAAAVRRPDPPGGYIGLGSQVWSWLVLDRLGVAGPDCLGHALTVAGLLPAAIADSESADVLFGTAGAIVPLLQLGERTGDARWTEVAVQAGDWLAAHALRPDGMASWAVMIWPEGIGGFSHGASGIGWALARLAAATGLERFAELAAAAAAFDETWYDRERAGYRDGRDPDRTIAAWCHGAVGIGRAAADLLGRDAEGAARHRDVLRRAAAATWREGTGWTHTLCHGDMGAWEVLSEALRAGLAPPGVDQPILDATVLGSLDKYGPVTGMVREVFSPGLLAGLGGAAYQLLRMHPDCDLPSALVLGDGPAAP